jgi:hypothetical protein
LQFFSAAEKSTQAATGTALIIDMNSVVFFSANRTVHAGVDTHVTSFYTGNAVICMTCQRLDLNFFEGF